MTGSGVERLVRTPSPAVVSTGAATPPPPSQVEGRTGRRRSRGLRWGLRTLVVGGLAGAAWLFSGAAAHAADAPAPVLDRGSSVVSLVNGPGSGADGRNTTGAAASRTVLDGSERLTGVVVGHRAAEGSGSHTDRPARQPAAAASPTDSITDPVQAAPAPVSTDELVAATNGVDGLVRVLAAPLRLTDGPARTRGVLAPLPTTEPI